MSLKLMYITNQPEVARIAEQAGVDWIFVDLELLDKDKRQGGMDTVQSHHTLDDVRRIKGCLSKSKLLVRCNHLYEGSKKEIDTIINNGADIVMLPYFKRIEEVRKFIEMVNVRAKTCLLVETAEAALMIDEILNIDGIDMIHIGLNDLHLALGKTFMFELMTDGIVDTLVSKIKAHGIKFGVGGIAGLNTGLVPGSMVVKEHYRIGSSMAIVSRSFCNVDKITDMDELRKIFSQGVAEIRDLEKEAQHVCDYFEDNHKEFVSAVKTVVKKVRENNGNK